MSRGVITLIDTVTQVSIKFQKKKKPNTNMGIIIEHNTNNGEIMLFIGKPKGRSRMISNTQTIHV